MKYFIDWANTKKFAVVDETQEQAKLVSFKALLKSLNKKDEVYVETGCPHSKIAQIANRGVGVYMVQGNDLSSMRESLNVDREFETAIKKTDKNDAILLRYAVLEKNVGGRLVSDTILNLKKQTPYASIYALFTDTCAQAKNMKSSFLREHPKNKKMEAFAEEVLGGQIDQLEKNKKVFQKEMDKEFGSAVKRLGIKGISSCLLGQILSLAHPAFYHCQSAYLKNAKLKKNTDHKYDRKLRSLFWNCTKEIIQHRSEPYRSMYDKMKIEWHKDKNRLAEYEEKKNVFEAKPENKHRTFSPIDGYIEGAICNRIATFIAKKVYQTFKNDL